MKLSDLRDRLKRCWSRRRGRRSASRGGAWVGLQALEVRVLLAADPVLPAHLPPLGDEAPAGEIHGRVFFDADGDGLRDAGEKWLAGQVVRLLPQDGGLAPPDVADLPAIYDVLSPVQQAAVVDLFGPAAQTTVTDALGRYHFTGVDDGEHTVEVVAMHPRGLRSPGAFRHDALVDADSGAGGVDIGVRSFHADLHLDVSDASLQPRYQAGRRGVVSVLIANRGDLMFNGDVLLRIYVTRDHDLTGPRVRVAQTVQSLHLRAGEAVKLELPIAIPPTSAALTGHVAVQMTLGEHAGDFNGRNDVGYSQRKVSIMPTAGGPVADVHWPGWLDNGDGDDGDDDGVVLPTAIEELDDSDDDAPGIGELVLSHAGLSPGDVLTLEADGVAGGADDVVRVLFYRDADRDGVLDPRRDDLLGIDVRSNGGWTLTVDADDLPAGVSKLFAIAQDESGRPSNVVDGYAWLAMSVDLPTNSTLTYADRSGSMVTVGVIDGNAELVFNLSPAEVWDIGDTIELTSRSTLDAIHLHNTTFDTVLRIDTERSNGNAGPPIAVGSITGNSTVGRIDAPNVLVNGDGLLFDGRGVAVNTELNGLIGGQWTMPGGAVLDQGVSVHVDRLQGSLDFAARVREVVATNWSGATLTAPSAGDITVENEFRAGDITLTDADADTSLDSLYVGRWLTNAMVRAASTIGQVSAAGMRGSGVLVGARSNLDDVPSALGDFADRRAVQFLTIRGFDHPQPTFIDAFVGAYRIYSLSLTGSADHANPDDPFGIGIVTLHHAAGVEPGLVRFVE